MTCLLTTFPGVKKNLRIGTIGEVRSLCPYKFIVLKGEKIEHTILSWGYYLGVLVFFRNRNPTHAEHINRAAEYFDLAERSSSVDRIRAYVRKAIPEIEASFRDLLRLG